MQNLTFERQKVNRENRRSLRLENAKEALGVLTPGCEIFLLSKGIWSLIDMVEVILDQTGPADLSITTWSCGDDDVRVLNRLLAAHIRRFRLLIDYSHSRMKKDVSAALLERFGADALRVGSIHAKLTLIGNEAWHLVLAGSMNLNRNPRLEHLTISDDAALYGFLSAFFDEAWAAQEPGRGFVNRPSDNIKDFRRMFAVDGLQRASASDLVRGRL